MNMAVAERKWFIDRLIREIKEQRRNR